MPDFTRALRWAVLTASGQAVDRPCRVYYARLVAITTGNQVAAASLRDDDTGTHAGPLVLGLAVTAANPTDDWPVVPISVAFLKGVDVGIDGVNVALLLGWNPD